MPDICAAILTEPAPSIARWRSEVPDGLQKAVARCMQKDPADRFQNVWELAVAIEPFAPRSARTAERVREVLFGQASHSQPATTPPSVPWLATARSASSPSGGNTRTAFGGGTGRTGSAARLAVAIGVGLCLAGAIMGIARWHSASHDSPPTEPSPAGATTRAVTASPGPGGPSGAPVLLAPEATVQRTPPAAAPVTADAATPIGEPATGATPSAKPAPPAFRRPLPARPMNPALHPESSEM
jgi:serine/threonine-protein kinase